MFVCLVCTLHVDRGIYNVPNELLLMLARAFILCCIFCILYFAFLCIVFLLYCFVVLFLLYCFVCIGFVLFLLLFCAVFCCVFCCFLCCFVLFC
jgi:hypothetical protein